MAQKIDLFKNVKEKATQAGAVLSDKATEAKEKAAQTGGILSDRVEEAKDKASQTGELLNDKVAEAKDKAAQTGELLSNKAAEAKEKAAQTGAFLGNKAAEAKRDYELRKYRPLTEKQLASALKEMPVMIRITDWDKRTEEAVCKNAVAFNDGTKELHFISVLTKNANLIDASFYPNAREGVYYRDPSNSSLYINLNDYFDYIKKAKVHELNQIAQALGAKHVRITLKAEQVTSVQNDRKINAGLGKKGKVSASNAERSKQLVSVEVASDKKYLGHEAQEPKLNYFKNEPDVKNIIRRRLDKSNPIYSDVETFKYNNSSSIKRNDAVKIDTALEKLKLNFNSSILSKVENEERIFFEYHIEYPEE